MASGGSRRAFDPHTLYDVSEEEMRLISARRDMRDGMKKDFMKKFSSPFKNPGDTLHDPSVQRFMSMKTYHYTLFKPTPKLFKFGFVSTLFPILLTMFCIDYFRDRFEKRVRRGEIAYKDRFFKI